MIKAGIDQEALIQMFAQATARQGESLRKAVGEATLKALQGRELTLENIRKVLQSVTQASTQGLARSALDPDAVEALLGKAFDGMDAALLQAVQANQRALEQFVAQGADLQDKQMQQALAGIEKMEDVFFSSVGKAAKTFEGPMQQSWSHVLDAMKMQGTHTGAQASKAVDDLVEQARDSLREGRKNSLKAAQAMMDSYAALVRGVLIGMSEGLSQGTAPAARPTRRK